MTQPMQDEHNAIARQPSLNPSEGRNRPPYSRVIHPVDLFHTITPSLWNIRALKGFVNGCV